MEIRTNYLTAGQFAKLACTTKRTILWYDEVGVLLPAYTDESGVRYYDPKQIIDFQIILLLRGYDVALKDIGDYYAGRKTLNMLLEAQTHELESRLANTRRLLNNLRKYRGTLAGDDLSV